MAWIVLIFVLESVSATSFMYSYGCYLELLNVSCTSGLIHPLSVRLGTYPSSQYCSETYPEGLNKSVIAKNDICIENELNSEQSYPYHEDCIGRTRCSPNATDGSLSRCSGSLSTNLTTFVEMQYECIADTRIITLGGEIDINKTSDTNASLYIQGNRYINDGRKSQANGFPVSCSICSSSKTSMIEIEILDLRLSSDNNGCTQTITLDKGNSILYITCNDNTNFTKGSVFETNTSCFTLTVSSDGGYFWFRFTSFASNGILAYDSMQMKCSTVVSTTTPATTTAIELYLGLGIGLPLLLITIAIALYCAWKKLSFRQCISGKNRRRRPSVGPGYDTECKVAYRESQETVADNPRRGVQGDEAICGNQENENTTNHNLDSYG